jgi:hypothetical protein
MPHNKRKHKINRVQKNSDKEKKRLKEKVLITITHQTTVVLKNNRVWVK